MTTIFFLSSASYFFTSFIISSSSIHIWGNCQTLILLSLEQLINYCLSSIHSIWVIGPACACWTYKGEPSFADHTVIMPSWFPVKISLFFSLQAIILHYPCKSTLWYTYTWSSLKPSYLFCKPLSTWFS
jgi:hypothetical protein